MIIPSVSSTSFIPKILVSCNLTLSTFTKSKVGTRGHSIVIHTGGGGGVEAGSKVWTKNH